jgi:hypothetical protein
LKARRIFREFSILVGLAALSARALRAPFFLDIDTENIASLFFFSKYLQIIFSGFELRPGKS